MRIGDFAASCGVNPKTVRFYEQQGLLPAPARTPASYRDYPPEAVARLGFIRDAQHAGLTLAEIRGILTLCDSGEAPCGHVSELIDRHLADIDRRLAELRATRAELTDLARRAADTDPSTCTGEAICTILSRPAQRRDRAAATATNAVEPLTRRTATDALPGYLQQTTPVPLRAEER